MDVFYLDEMETLGHNIFSALEGWAESDRREARQAWGTLRVGARDKWKWEVGDLDLSPNRMFDGDDEEDERGEFAPVVVEI